MPSDLVTRVVGVLSSAYIFGSPQARLSQTSWARDSRASLCAYLAALPKVLINRSRIVSQTLDVGIEVRLADEHLLAKLDLWNFAGRKKSVESRKAGLNPGPRFSLRQKNMSRIKCGH